MRRKNSLPTNGSDPAARILPKILVAEDNAVNRLVIEAMLETMGVAPAMAHDGLQAVNAWRMSDWDVILMDVQMPTMDGVTATQTIRAEELTLGRTRTPIIGVTANVMIDQLEAYRAAGMDAVVAKPIDFRRLLDVIEVALDTDEAEAQSPRVTGLAEPLP